MRSESQILKDIINYLKKLKSLGYPIDYERRQAGGFSYKSGRPDLYFVYNGQHIEVETKTEIGELRSMQEVYKKYFESINIIYICARSLDDVKKVMKSKFNLDI